MTLAISAQPFAALDAAAAYDVWRLRQQVFVVEQECAYPDLDGRDPEPGTRHVLLTDDGELVGYARVLDDATTWRVGRCWPPPRAAEASPTSWCAPPSTSAPTATSCSTPSRP